MDLPESSEFPDQSPPTWDDYDDDNDNDIQECELYDIELHPRVKDLHKNYDITHKYCDLSIEEKAHFDEGAIYLQYCAFFGGITPVNYSKYYGGLIHKIRTYTLYKLVQNKEIKLFSFNNSAALIPLKIANNVEVPVPFKGAFVIEKDNITIVLKICPCGSMFEWDWYTKNSKEFSEFNKFFCDAINKYNQYKGCSFDDTGNFIDLPSASFSDIFLPVAIREEVQKNIIDYVDIEKLEIKRKNGLPTKRGIIMVGAPGTGKTFLSRVLANTLKTTFMVVTNLRSPEDIKDVFSFAKMFDRIIVLFEDIDIYVGNRDRDMVSTLLNMLDGLEVNNHLIVLCTTNNIEALDIALRDRPGRFDRILYFDPPNTALKAEMLKNFCKDKIVNDVDFIEVVKDIPHEYTGAYIKELYITAVTEAINCGSINENNIAVLTTEILKNALETLRKSKKEKVRIGFDTSDK
jgi:hypothetical protein